jgi:hypothetical protein
VARGKELLPARHIDFLFARAEGAKLLHEWWMGQGHTLFRRWEAWQVVKNTPLEKDFLCRFCMKQFYSDQVEESCNCQWPLCPDCGKHLDPGHLAVAECEIRDKENEQ